MRRAKIVCTLGPATATAEKIGALIDAGMDVARLNFSHGDYADHEASTRSIRAEAERRGRSVAILQDLQGPKIRVGRFETGAARLIAGDKFTITTDTGFLGDTQRVSTTYAGLPGDVHPGDAILLDDGYLELEAVEIAGNDVITRVTRGGLLKNNKGINLPNADVSARTLTDKDRRDLAFGLSLGVDYIALSFVRSAACIREARALADVDGHYVPIIAKIERPQAIECLDEIVEAAHGTMVARGDLGVELGPEKVPLLQKKIINATNDKGKLVITATQMLESMITNARPTRAEASDVANAVLDGTDALMLSGETAAGAHPIAAVETMSRIISEVESSSLFRAGLQITPLDMPLSSNAVAHAAVIAARQLGIRSIVVVSHSGRAARLMSEYRPEADIFALTPSESRYRRLAPYWGVTPILTAPAATTDEMLTRVEQVLSERKLATPGELVAVTLGVPVGSGEATNLLKLHRMP